MRLEKGVRARVPWDGLPECARVQGKVQGDRPWRRAEPSALHGQAVIITANHASRRGGQDACHTDGLTLHRNAGIYSACGASQRGRCAGIGITGCHRTRVARGGASYRHKTTPGGSRVGAGWLRIVTTRRTSVNPSPDREAKIKTGGPGPDLDVWGEGRGGERSCECFSWGCHSDDATVPAAPRLVLSAVHQQ